MDSRRLAEDDIQNYILSHEKDDPEKLVLKEKTILGVPSAWIAAQLKARKKTEYKLPLFYDTRGIVYPPSVNLEQSSSEATARFKTQVVSKWITSGKKFCDLTGGFGVDSFFLSSAFPYCDFAEPQKELLELAEQNHRLLGVINIHYHWKDALEFISASGKHYDLIYLDPSRRSSSQKKVFKFSDCSPDVVSNAEDFYRHTNRLMIKASPMLDIQQGIKDLKCVARVLVVSVDNECKELVFLCDKKATDEPIIECYDLPNDINWRMIPSGFEFRFSDEKAAAVVYSDPLKFLYEPNASIMKGGAFKSIASAYSLSKLQQNTHLYTSSARLDDFPGRIFQITESVKPDKTLSSNKVNILLRNYPSTIEALKKKTGVKEGGDSFLIGCSGVKDKFLLLADRLK